MSNMRIEISILNEKISNVKERVMKIDGRMVSLEGNLKSANDTSKNNLHASSSGKSNRLPLLFLLEYFTICFTIPNKVMVPKLILLLPIPNPQNVSQLP